MPLRRYNQTWGPCLSCRPSAAEKIRLQSRAVDLVALSTRARGEASDLIGRVVEQV